MFDFQPRQCLKEPAIFSLPEEILDEIVTELDHHKDVVAFALASRACARAVIPHHTQYRVLRVRHPLPDMWAHLARRSDLTRNIRELHICERHNYTVPDHYPTTLIDSLYDRGWNNGEESTRIRNICQAIGHMYRLRVFSWSWNNIPHQVRPTSHPLHENAILTAVSRLPCLQALRLTGKFAIHALHSIQDPGSLTYPLWGVANLRYLTLAGDTWARIGNSRHLCALLSKSPNLEYLEVPLEFHHLAECKLPNLKKLRLIMQSGANMAIDQSRALFLQNHPSIEELSWCPIGSPWIPPTALPNLKSLVTNMQFILAMDDPNYGSGSSVGTITSLPTPPATPSTPTAPSSTDSDMSVLESPRIVRRVEALNVASMSPQTLLDLKCLDRASLRKLRLDTFDDLSALHEVAEAFPNLEWLALPRVYLPSDSSHPALVSKEQWLQILPRFKKLQVFRGSGLWTSVKDDLEDMHQLILQLAESCPNLRELDHRVFYEKYDAFKRIVISRQGTAQQVVSYSVLRPRPRYPFDVMDGIFD